jgi:hypothetical protein
VDVFISYSWVDLEAAKLVYSTLTSAGYEVFLDRHELEAGEEFAAKIRGAIFAAGSFIFIASERSIRPDKFAMLELAIAEERWANPSGVVLPVLLGKMEAQQLPSYLRPLVPLQFESHFEARVLSWVEGRMSAGTARLRDQYNPGDRLETWARNASPPSRLPKRELRSFFYLRFVWALVSGWLAYGWYRQEDVWPACAAAFITLAIVVFAALRAKRVLLDPLAVDPVAVVRLSTNRERAFLLKLDGSRLEVDSLGKGEQMIEGEIGWAYLSGDLLVDFKPASTMRHL